MRAAVLLLLAMALPGAARADSEQAAMNRVGFGVERTREVENDRVTAVVAATREDADPARLAARINEDMTWALGLAKAASRLRVRSGGYRTWPLEDARRPELRRWRGTQELVVEGSDVAAVSELLGRLQERLQLARIEFGVSPERRRAVEAELVDEALDAFRARAERIQRKLGALRYELVHVQVDAGGGAPPVPVRARTLGAMAEGVAPPAFEGGTSTLRARAHGTIELVF